MSIPDRLIWNYYELSDRRARGGPAGAAAPRRVGEENPRDAKADLARIVTGEFHGREAAVRAEEDFRRAFSKGELPEEIEATELPAAETSAARVLVAAGLAASMREARRKIAEGALALYESGEARVVRDAEERLDASRPTILRLGRRFRRIVWRT